MALAIDMMRLVPLWSRPQYGGTASRRSVVVATARRAEMQVDEKICRPWRV